LVPVRAGSRRLDESELVQVFREAEGSELWTAIAQVLGDHYTNAVVQVGNPDLADRPGALAHCAGGMEWLGYAIGELEERVYGKPESGERKPERKNSRGKAT
jgi:hypothetical protein